MAIQISRGWGGGKNLHSHTKTNTQGRRKKCMLTCWKAALICPWFKRRRIWFCVSCCTSWVPGTGVTAPERIALKTLSLIVLPCAFIALLTSSLTTSLTWVNKESFNLEKKRKVKKVLLFSQLILRKEQRINIKHSLTIFFARREINQLNNLT